MPHWLRESGFGYAQGILLVTIINFITTSLTGGYAKSPFWWVWLVSDVVEKTSTRRRSRISCVVVEKLRRVDLKA